jgi:hypothetical protein
MVGQLQNDDPRQVSRSSPQKGAVAATVASPTRPRAICRCTVTAERAAACWANISPCPKLSGRRQHRIVSNRRANPGRDQIEVHISRLQANVIIRGAPEPLLTAQVSVGRLHRNVPQQKLDLLQFSYGQRNITARKCVDNRGATAWRCRRSPLSFSPRAR